MPLRPPAWGDRSAATAAAWIGFAICLVGTLMAVGAILSGQASVLYTFYPPLLASGWYYGGAFLLVGGSMIWVVLMILNMSGLETGQSRAARAAADVRHHGDRNAVGVGGDRRAPRARRHIAAAGLRLERSDRCRARARRCSR